MLVVVVCCTDSAGNQLGGKQVRGVERTSPHSLFGSEQLKYKIPSFFPHCLLYTSPSPRDATLSRMPSSA